MFVRRIQRLAVVAAVAGTTALTGCADDATPSAEPVVGAPAAPTVGERDAEGGLAQESIEDRIGQTVSVRGEVAEQIAPNAFTLGGDEIGDNPVLVVGKTPVQVADGDTVSVTGPVLRFQLAGAEDAFDLDLVDNEFTDFTNDPYIQATTVTKQ